MIYVFDVDGVLCESKTNIDTEMGTLLKELSEEHTIVFLTGGKLKQVTSQVISKIDDIKKPFYILPLSGADAWEMDEAENIRLWNNHLTLEEKGRVYSGIIHTLSGKVKPIITWGEIAEDRGSQITISLLGMNAPWYIKKYYDPDKKIRNEIVWRLINTIIKSNDFDFRIGGSTSIDITKKGVNKGNSLLNLQRMMNWDMETITFVGDNLQPGGNDYPVLQSGFGCVEVKDVEDTKKYIKAWLNK